ncbi:MAG TPA: type I glyceraldehyde-3-phosphate dehydrogenase [Chloroflexota bacterium]|nr:type I glyceraldehyde-3-phosphate dehydrogenase [Chloroflexota bacterium]
MRRRIAINGFGRIGRLTFRCILERHPNDLQIVAINDPAGAHIDALLLQYDSIYGRFKGEVICEPGRFIVDGTPVEVFRERDWHNLPWGELGIHTVLECSGQGVTAAAASVHLERGARDPREARAAALNIIPTSTGAAKALPKVLPALAGNFDGLAFRVPTPTVSAIDFVCETTQPVTVESVNEAFKTVARGRLQGIIDFCAEPLVSMDFKGDSHSAIIDGLSTFVLDNRIVKVIAWYDNEWGYSCRLSDLAAYIARRDVQSAAVVHRESVDGIAVAGP